MKKIAVCGHSSNLGRIFINQYQGQYEIIKIGRRDADIILDLETRCVSGNIDLLKDCEALVNFSAKVDDGSIESIISILEVNVAGSLFLAGLVKEYNISMFINISSISATYGTEDPYYSYYAQNKKSAEELLELYCKKNDIKLCILRPSSIIGDDAFALHQPLVYGLINKVKNNESITIYGKKDAKRNYIHAATVSDVINGAINNKVTGIYNVVNLHNDSLSEIVEKLNEKYNSKSQIIFLEDKADVVERIFIDDGKVYELTDVVAPRGIELERME